MKLLLFFAGLCLLCVPVCGQKKSLDKIEKIRAFQKELNEEFADPGTSPLKENDLQDFSRLEFFPIDTSYYIVAKFIRTENQKPFKMATSTDRSPVYEKYGEAHFVLDSVPVVLEIYQSHDLRKTEEYEDYLFLPFTDLSNGEETYGGGRYIGLTIPEDDSIVIDFNQAYNPYCAYNDRYSCPLVPRQNRIKLKVKAGVMAFKGAAH